MFTPSAEETVLVAQILAEASSKHGERDSITPEQALDILVGARLEPDVLLAILALAVTEQTLSRTELGVAVRLIGWAQEGISITPPLVHRCGPAAVITGLPIIHRNSKTRKSSKEGDSVPPNPSAYPPLNSACRERYVAVFKTGKPVDGVLNGNKVWKAFNVSNLPIKTLAGIWDLVDTKGTGDLTLHEFVLGMYFVDGIMRRRFDSIPSEVPSFLHSQVNDPVPLLITHPKHRWVVTSAIRETAAASFGTLDPENQGYISPDVFFDYIADSKLPEDDLNEIWHLADIGDKGQLTRDEFALALFLMHMKLAGMYLPTVLPPDFIPKSSPSSPTTSDLRSPKKSTPEWVIPSPVQANATDAFAILDVGGKGRIDKDAVTPFLNERKLSERDIARLWSLTDTKRQGYLTHDDFVIMLYLMHRRLAGLQLPSRIPGSLRREHKSLLLNYDLNFDEEPADQDALLLKYGLRFDSESQTPESSKTLLPASSQESNTKPPKTLPTSLLESKWKPLPELQLETQSAPPDLHSQIGELRAMIEGLQRDNHSLRQSVDAIQLSDGSKPRRSKAPTLLFGPRRMRSQSESEAGPPAYAEAVATRADPLAEIP